MAIRDRTTSPGSRLIVGNRYEIDLGRRLDQGGIAVVYEGRDLRLDRAVAVKSLLPQYARNPEFRRRFRQEAAMTVLVSHPNVVRVLDRHEDDTGSWVIMELVPGENLRRVMDRHGPMSPADVMPLLAEVASALDALHKKRLVHLDIKPQNIMLMPDGHIKLIDFGLVQPSGESQQMVGGTALGTTPYLAPEQAGGEAVWPQSDIYSLACVIYEMLTGQPPFGAPAGPAQKSEVIQAHIKEIPVAPSEARPDLHIPSWVDDVLGWALEKRPSDRFPDVLAFARQFRTGLEGEKPNPPNPDPGSRTEPIEQEPRPPLWSRVFPRPAGPMPARETTRWDRIYAAGGRAARNSGRLRHVLWRAVLFLLVFNLLMGTVILVRGGPSALVERFLSIAPNTTTTVVVQGLNLRPSPSTETVAIAVLEEGQTVRVTGLPERADGYTFWPVDVELDGQQYSGWVWEDGLAPNVWTGRLGWMQGVVDKVHSIGDSVSHAGERVRGAISWLWPFWIVGPVP